LTRHTMPSTVVSLHHDGTTLHVGCAFGSYVTVYRLDGALVEVGPSVDLVYHGLGRPGAYPTMPRDSTLRLLDASGGVVADTGWPSAAAWEQSAYVGSAPHNDGGWVSAWWAFDWD